MKKIAFLSLFAVFAFIVLSSFVKLNNHTENNLGKNQDFKNWLSAVTSLKTKVEKTNSKTSFTGFINKTNSNLENENLAKALGFHSNNELVKSFKQMNNYLNNFVKATPELTPDKSKVVFREALQQNLQDVPDCFDVWSLTIWNCWSTFMDQENQDEMGYNACLNRAYLNYIICTNLPIE